MKNIIWIIGLLFFSFNMNGQQDKLMYGTSCECKSFIEKQSLSNDVEEIGIYEAFPELIKPKANEVEQYLRSKINKPIDMIYSLKISKAGKVDCIYLAKGNPLDDAAIKLSNIIVNEFLFKPAIRRGKPIDSIFILKISL